MRILNTYTTYQDPDNLFTIEEQLDKCCEILSPQPDVCSDVGKEEPYESADVDDIADLIEGLRQAHLSNPLFTGNVVIETTGPAGPCGTMFTTWGDAVCCDDVVEMEYDTTSSFSVLAQNSSAYAYVTDGKGPYTWTLGGYGFYFQGGVVRRATTTRYIRVYAASDSCGVGIVSCLDSCGTLVSNSFMSDTGVWNGHCGAFTLEQGSTGSGACRPIPEPLYEGGILACRVQYGDLDSGAHTTCTARSWQWDGSWTQVWGQFMTYCNDSITAWFASGGLKYSGDDINDHLPDGPPISEGTTCYDCWFGCS